MNNVYSRKPLRPLNKKCPPGYIERGGICVLDTRRNANMSSFGGGGGGGGDGGGGGGGDGGGDGGGGDDVGKKTKKKIPYKEIIGVTAGAGAVAGAIYKREAIVDMGRSARRSAQRVINRNNAKKFDGEPSEMGRLLDELEAGEGFEMSTITRTPPQPPPQPSTTNQQLRIRQRIRQQPRGDSQVSVQRPSIRGNANNRSGMDPANSFKEALARRQKERQAEMDAEQRQPLIDQRTTPKVTEKTPLIENENVAGDTFPMERGIFPDKKYLNQRGVSSNERGGGGGGRTESRSNMESRRSSKQVKQVTQEQAELGETLQQDIGKLKEERKIALDKKNNPDGQAEEVDMETIDTELEKLDKEIAIQEEAVDDIFGGVEIDDAGELQEKTSLANQVKAEKLAKEQAQASKEAAEKYKAKQAKGGLDAGAEVDAVLEPITQEELETIPIQGEGAIEVGEAGAVEIEGATSLIGEIAVTTGGEVTAAAILGGEVAAGEAAAFIAGGLASNLLIGAALYGLGVGAEALYDAVTTSDKEYSDQRNTELGSHEMDRREVQYKLQELGAARDIYEKKVNQGYSVSNKDPKAIAQHESDIAMLNALQTNIDSLNESFRNDIPVYAVVENGFDVDMLDGDEKETYDKLTKRVNDAQDDINYGGSASKAENQKRLEKRQRKLDEFISARSNASIASGFLNKPTDDMLEAIVDDYYENGTDAFGNLSSEQLEVLGITEAISDRREQQEIAGGNFDVKELTDQEVDAFWEEEQRQWAEEDAVQQAIENDESFSDYNKKRAAYFSDHPEEVAAMENDQQETAEPSHQDDARGLAQTDDVE